MTFTAKTVAPCPVSSTVRQPVFAQVAQGGHHTITAPPGYLLTECLAGALLADDRPVVWLHLGPEDRDPATFLISLIAAARRVCPEVGQSTLERLRRQPGPIAGWPPLFQHLGEELAGGLPASCAVVLEGGHYLDDIHQALALLGKHLLPALPPSMTFILTTARPLPAAALPAGIRQLGVDDLRLDTRTAAALAHGQDVPLSGVSLQRALALTEGRAVALAGLGAAGLILGPAVIQGLLQHAGGAADLLAGLAKSWLTLLDPGARQALALTARIDLVHPALISAALGSAAAVPEGPWLQPLADGWSRRRELWQPPLRSVLRGDATPERATLQRAAAYLAGEGAPERAVGLYLEAGDGPAAAGLAAGAADDLINTGQWATLGDWLRHIPPAELGSHPRLLHASGELAVAEGQAETARRAFATAVTAFTTQRDAEGACRSLLADSQLALRQGDLGHARMQALAAAARAEAAGLVEWQGWAAWQLGGVAVRGGELDDAVAYLGRAGAAAELAGNSDLIHLVHHAETLVLEQRGLRQQCQLRHQALAAAEQAERLAAERLSLAIDTSVSVRRAYSADDAWGGEIPLALKLPSRATSEGVSGDRATAATQLGLFSRVREVLGLGGASPEALADARPTDQTPAVQESSVALTVHMLGDFHVCLNDQPVSSWPAGRGRAVLKYLLAYRERPVGRDVLTEAIWPEADPDAARNRLNNAVSGLRQALRAVEEVPVVIYHDGAYSIHPELTVWLDAEEFERHVQAGRKLEAAGQLIAAIAEYEIAVDLYLGDFAAEDPYDDWPVLKRERLRMDHLDALDRLSHLYFGQGLYAACAALCQRILSYDNCREDAHRRLMRCHARQGQYPPALRQYQACVEALRSELDVAPAATTRELAERIRRREGV
jgi:DNA-binding SARP family transcriptional activator